MLSDDFLLVLVALHAHDGAVGGGVGREEDVALASDSERDYARLGSAGLRVTVDRGSYLPLLVT